MGSPARSGSADSLVVRAKSAAPAAAETIAHGRQFTHRAGRRRRLRTLAATFFAASLVSVACSRSDTADGPATDGAAPGTPVDTNPPRSESEILATTTATTTAATPPTPAATSIPTAADQPVAPQRVASIRTPASVSTSAWTDDRLAFAVFEQLSDDVAIDIVDRSTGDVRRVVLPDSYIVYAMRFDRSDPSVLWVSTSQRGQLFRVDTRTLRARHVQSFGDERFIFGMAQSASGAIYVGTYPDAVVHRVDSPSDSPRITEVSLDESIVGARTNVKDIVANGTGQVFFHLGSPGRLIGYDEATGRTSPILDTDEPFLFPARDFPRAIEAISTAADLGPRELNPVQVDAVVDLPWWAETFLPERVFTTRADGTDFVVTHDDRTTHLSMEPRNGGMPIVAFDKVGRDRAIGGTYWNRWFFEFDLETSIGVARGVTGRTGEFFTACGDGDRAYIPHYLGVLLQYDPQAPFAERDDSSEPAAGTIAGNPSELLEIADGHIGLTCLVLGRDVYYAMLPNYGQRVGLVAHVRDDAIENVVTPRQTFGRLALVDGSLFAASSDFIGLGLDRPAETEPMRVVQLDPDTLQEVRSAVVPLGESKYASALVDAGDGLLVLGAEGGLFVVDTRTTDLTVRAVGGECRGVSAAQLLRPGIVVLICADQLFSLSSATLEVRKIVDLPVGSAFLAIGPDGSAFTTAGSDIYRTGADAIERAAAG